MTLETLGKEVLISKDIIPNIAVQNSVFFIISSSISKKEKEKENQKVQKVQKGGRVCGELMLTWWWSHECGELMLTWWWSHECGEEDAAAVDAAAVESYEKVAISLACTLVHLQSCDVSL
jgi:hypothetical protein